MGVTGLLLASWNNQATMSQGRVFMAQLVAGWNRPPLREGGVGGGVEQDGGVERDEGKVFVFAFPYSVQAVMWLVCFLAAGELAGRYAACRDEEGHFGVDFFVGVPGNIVFGKDSQALVRIRE